MLLLLFILIAMLNPVAGQKGTGDGAGSGADAVKPKLTYRITAAKGWEKTDTLIGNSLITLIISPLEHVGDTFRENLNIVTEDVGNMEMEEYYDISLQHLNSLPELKKQGMMDTVMNGIDFRILHYTFAAETFDAEALVYFTIIKGKSYVITCGCLKGRMGYWRETFEEMIASFKVD